MRASVRAVQKFFTHMPYYYATATLPLRHYCCVIVAIATLLRHVVGR